MKPFHPPFGLRGGHVQSILASTGPRRWRVERRARPLVSQSCHHILHCRDRHGDEVRLDGEYTAGTGQDTLVILIHGWLGSNASPYILSAANQLWREGHSIFRLNLRDHGNTAHLNRGLFHSARLQEVIDAVRIISERFSHRRVMLIGFSLGGNFALRIARQAPANQLTLSRVIAVCPPIDPPQTNRQLNQGGLYHRYFVNKWRGALEAKLRHYANYNYADTLPKLRTLDDFNAFFVPRYTEYDTVDDYLRAYSIAGDYLHGLQTDCHIISSADDPVINRRELQLIASSPHLTVELTQHGGHCGFICDYHFRSWVDQRIIELIERENNRGSKAQHQTVFSETSPCNAND